MDTIINEEEVTELKSLIKDKFGPIAQTYIRCAEEYMHSILEGFENGDMEAVVEAAHPLKSSSGNLGLRALSALAKDIEMKGTAVMEGQGQAKELKPFIEKLEALNTESSKALASLIDA